MLRPSPLLRLSALALGASILLPAQQKGGGGGPASNHGSGSSGSMGASLGTPSSHASSTGSYSPSNSHFYGSNYDRRPWTGRPEVVLPPRPKRDPVNPYGDHLVRPRSTPRCTFLPTWDYWHLRWTDLYDHLMFMYRRGYVPVTVVPPDTEEIVDHAETPAGWRAYGFIVPPGESISFNLDHPNRPWFRLIICDRWGKPVPGGLSSLMPQHEPALSYTNPSRKDMAIYLMVDDPGWMSSKGNPYTLRLKRSWDPAKYPISPETLQKQLPLGIWGLERSISAAFARPTWVMPGFK